MKKQLTLILLGILVSFGTSAEETLHFIHTDHLGTPIMLTDMDQNVVWKVESQTPFGEVVVNEDPDGDGDLVEFDLRFPGQYFDKETGTNYNWHRTYDPLLGRYLTSDPIGLDDGPNTYSYVYNNPLNYYDPDGLSGLKPLSSGAGARSLGGGTGGILGGAGSSGHNPYSALGLDRNGQVQHRSSTSNDFGRSLQMAGSQTTPNPISHDRENEILYGDPLGCDEIEAAIRDLRRTIDWRRGDLNPAQRGTPTYVGHANRIRILRRRLDELRRKARDWGCNPDPECGQN